LNYSNIVTGTARGRHSLPPTLALCAPAAWQVREEGEYYIPCIPEDDLAPGRGKRGGYRIIYYLRRTQGIIWMLTMYPKNVAGTIPADVLKKIREEIEDGQG
jgi:hypothetical protein